MNYCVSLAGAWRWGAGRTTFMHISRPTCKNPTIAAKQRRCLDQSSKSSLSFQPSTSSIYGDEATTKLYFHNLNFPVQAQSFYKISQDGSRVNISFLSFFINTISFLALCISQLPRPFCSTNDYPRFKGSTYYDALRSLYHQ